MSIRRTKIIATLGPATEGPGMLDALVAAGMDCARLNCSHGDEKFLLEQAEAVRAAETRAGRPIPLLLDLQGPKIRLSNDALQRQVKVGDEIVFTERPVRQPEEFEVIMQGFVKLCTAESVIVIGDGTPRFEIKEIRDDAVVAVAVVPGELSAGKGVYVTPAHSDYSALTAKDRDDIQVASVIQPEFVALSFVRSAQDILALRVALNEAGCGGARVIAKIEKIEALTNLDEIIKAADGVMVARGDYGVEAGLAYVPAMQKTTIHRGVEEGKLVITATEMLQSMVAAPKPTRAEVLDVHNAILDGTSAVMLSAETSVGQFPVEAVATLDEIAVVAEGADIYCAPHGERAENADAAVMYAAVALGRDTNAAALVVPTSTGGTARACAKYRPARPVLALCHEERIARQLALEWGIYPTMMPLTDSVDELVETAVSVVKTFPFLDAGDKVVVTAGPKVGASGATNFIVLKTIP